MKLDGPQVGQFTAILVDAFSQDEIRFLLIRDLNFNLDAEVTTTAGWKMVAFELIRNFNKRGCIADLIKAVRQERASNAEVVRYCDEALGQLDAPDLKSTSLQDAAKGLQGLFNERLRFFKYLISSKEMHDVLHKLQSLYVHLAAAVQVRMDNPNEPLAEDVALALEEHLETVNKSVENSEFPRRPPDWVARLSSAFAVLKGKGDDVGKLRMALERLQHLPAKELKPVNDMLFRDALRLNVDELTSALNQVLESMPAAGASPVMVKARTEVEKLWALCVELTSLIETHDLCQSVDVALREADGLVSVTPDTFMDWPDVKAKLKKLETQWPKNGRIKQTYEAAQLFESTSQRQAFDKLVELFNHVFLKTDDALLKVTYKMPIAAGTLTQALGTLQ